MNAQQLQQAKILVRRLERLSADSVWAHRASGVRASIDKYLEKINIGQAYDPEHLGSLIHQGFKVIEKAAQEIPEPEEILFRSNSSKIQPPK